MAFTPPSEIGARHRPPQFGGMVGGPEPWAIENEALLASGVSPGLP
jgi:hypothetical protein